MEDLSKFMKSKYLSQRLKRDLVGLAAYKVAKRLIESPLGQEMEEARAACAVVMTHRYNTNLPPADMEVLAKYGEASPVHVFTIPVDLIPEKYRQTKQKDSKISRLSVPLLPLGFCLVNSEWKWAQYDVLGKPGANGDDVEVEASDVWKNVMGDWALFGPAAAVNKQNRCYWKSSFGDLLLANLGRINLPKVYNDHYNYSGPKPMQFGEEHFFSPEVLDAAGLYLALVIEAANEWKQKHCAYQMMINKKATFGSLAAVWPEVVPYFKLLFREDGGTDSCTPLTEEDAVAMISQDMIEGHEAESIK